MKQEPRGKKLAVIFTNNSTNEKDIPVGMGAPQELDKSTLRLNQEPCPAGPDFFTIEVKFETAVPENLNEILLPGLCRRLNIYPGVWNASGPIRIRTKKCFRAGKTGEGQRPSESP
jgi:hypothetical protein